MTTTSYFAPQYKKNRAFHSKLKDGRDRIRSLVASIRKATSIEDHDSIRIELRTAFSQLREDLGTYSSAVNSLRRKVEHMSDNTTEQQELKDTEVNLFEELKDGNDDGLAYDDVSLSDNALPSISIMIDETIVSSRKDLMDKSPHQSDSIQVTPVTQNSSSSLPTPIQCVPPMSESITNALADAITTAMSKFAGKSDQPPLKPITLVPFDGETTQWESFYRQYSETIDCQSQLSNHSKLIYLREALTGSAFETVQYIPVGNDYLQDTIDRLKSVYGQSKRSNTRLIRHILEIRPKSNSFEDQLKCTRQLMNKVFQLHDKSLVDNFTLIHQVAGNIHSHHVKRMYQLEPDTMMQALEHIESDLRERIEIRDLQFTFRPSNRSDQFNPREKPSNRTNDKNSIDPSRHKQPFKGPSCVYCGKHEFSFCTNITSIDERKSILKEKKLCSRCLSSQHSFKDCDKKCSQCTKFHHRSLCHSTPSTSKPNHSINASITSTQPTNGISRLSTASVSLQNPVTNRPAKRQVFLDTGAMVSLISRSLANELNLKPHSTASMTISGVGGEPTGGNLYDVVTVNIVTTKGLHPINAFVIDTVITSSMNHQPLSSEDYAIVQTHCGEVSHFTHSSNVTPDLLIGNAFSLEVLSTSKYIPLPSGYYLLQSMLGPIISGECNSNTVNSKEYIPQQKILSTIISDAPFEDRVERFLSVDETGRDYSTTEAEARFESDQKVEQHFHDTVQKDGDKFQVQYYVKPEVSNLPTNFELAYSRLKSTVISLSKNNTHITFYDSIIKDQLNAGMIEEADSTIPSDHNCHYLAHQAVLRPDKPTTPLLIVYDASAKLKGKPCLNDVIAQGPCTLEQIPSLLIRTRSRKVLIIADVEKAFLQVGVHPSQRDLLRFLWIKDLHKPVTKDNLITYRFTVTPFGVNQSPYLLSKVIETHLREASNTTNEHLITQLVNNVYVDNVIINTDHTDVEMYTMSKSLFAEMHMNLRDYASNSTSFIESVLETDRAPPGDQKLLGIMWNPSTDSLSIRIPSLPKHETETKRSMLSSTASIFDPVGFLQPLTLQAKSLVQQLWCQDLKWDQAVDPTITSRFHSMLTDIESFHLAIPRYNGMSSSNEIHLVAFADASKLAMGAVIYLWNPNNSTILMSRSRLAPAKAKATIPKLELNALVMAHTLLQYVVNAIRKEFPTSNIHTHVFSDSAITLFWCLNDPNKKNNGVFVANRVQSIRATASKLSSMPNVYYNSPRYVKTDSNPADHISRGLSANEMNDPNHMWWKGAPWMKDPPEKWPNHPIPPTADPPYTRTVELVPSPLIDLERCSTLNKATTIIGFVLRFIQRSTSNSTNSTLKEKYNEFASMSTRKLTSLERIRALTTLIRNHQSCTIQTHDSWIKNGIISKDDNDIWRANTRLDHAIIPSDARSPILIPTNKDSKFARLIIADVHESMFHAGTENVLNQLKQQYWIPRSRKLVKSQIRACFPCRKTNNLPYSYTATPPLPSDRVVMSKPFQSTGVDFIGPFTSKDNAKMYSVIFTCLSSRLTHIEVTDSLLPSAFINAFRRFTSRRGTPTAVLSDQATTLKLSRTLLDGFDSEQALNTLFQAKPIHWKFTTSHAPWKGAVYERLIRIFKDCLSRSIGKRKLTFDEFSTITAEIEAVLNSRPLTYVSSDDVQSFNNPVLRPIDLIMPDSTLAIRLHSISNDSDRGYLPPGEENMSRSTAILQLARTIDIIESFWSKWHIEYLTTIRDSKKDPDPLHGYRSSSISPKPGAIVLVIDESGNTPRSTWHMAKIISVSGSEATLKSHSGRIIQRPINLLIPLELDSIEDPIDSTSTPDHQLQHNMMTRSKSRQAGGNLIDSMPTS